MAGGTRSPFRTPVPGCTPAPPTVTCGDGAVTAVRDAPPPAAVNRAGERRIPGTLAPNFYCHRANLMDI